MDDSTFSALVRAVLAAKKLQHKKIARKCGVSRPAFSEMVNGEKPMPEIMKLKLIRELDLKPHLERAGLC